MVDYTDFKKFVEGKSERKHLPTVYNFAPTYAGIIGGMPSLTRFYFDVEEKLRCQLKLIKLFPEAFVFPGIFADFGVITEVSAFGGQMVWDDNMAPYCHPALRDIVEVDHLKAPIPGKTGLTAILLLQKRIMQEKCKLIGEEIAKFSLTMGAAEIAGLLLGYDKYFMALYTDPQRIKLLMEMLTEYLITWLKKQGEITGGNEVIMIGDHVLNQIQPDLAEELIFPYIKAIFNEFPNCIKIYHNEGLHRDGHLKLVLNFGADIWHFGSDVHDLNDLFNKVDEKIILFGGLNPLGNLRKGSTEDVIKEASEVKKIAKDKRLMFSSGTGTTPDTTLENMKALIGVAL